MSSFEVASAPYMTRPYTCSFIWSTIWWLDSKSSFYLIFVVIKFYVKFLELSLIRSISSLLNLFEYFMSYLYISSIFKPFLWFFISIIYCSTSFYNFFLFYFYYYFYYYIYCSSLSILFYKQKKNPRVFKNYFARVLRLTKM